jgi:hypothetical protein
MRMIGQVRELGISLNAGGSEPTPPWVIDFPFVPEVSKFKGAPASVRFSRGAHYKTFGSRLAPHAASLILLATTARTPFIDDLSSLGNLVGNPSLSKSVGLLA